MKPTTGPGVARQLAAEAVGEGYKTIVAAGGDGTLNEVLNGIADAPKGFSSARLAVLPLAFLMTEAPAAAFPAAAYLAATVPLVASLGLWLSIRCRTLTRAVLWLLLVIGGLTLVPVMAWNLATEDVHFYLSIALTAAAATVAGAAWIFWHLALREFEREGR